ncbi:MAG TPA: hypothetical protein VK540_35550 [Polyangiaceae bacterium]|nr:hypothetical protein [Polyangiaceae bacterium]
MTNRATRAGVVTCLASIVSWFALSAPGCHMDNAHLEGVDISTYPVDVHDDYALFTVRCSKCHALSRALQSGITDDAYWADYVERMRRQPGSGIAPEESPRIQRFLHYYSLTVRARNAAPAPEAVPSPSAQDGGDAW